MKPVKFKECNVVFGENQVGYLPLPAYKEQNESGQVVTCWELSESDLKMLQRTKKVYVSTLTFNSALQPLFLSVNKGEIFVSPEED